MERPDDPIMNDIASAAINLFRALELVRKRHGKSRFPGDSDMPILADYAEDEVMAAERRLWKLCREVSQ